MPYMVKVMDSENNISLRYLKENNNMILNIKFYTIKFQVKSRYINIKNYKRRINKLN